MDPDSGGETATDILANRTEEEIADIIYGFGEERFSRRIARRIVESRDRGQPVRTTKELVDLVERSVRRSPRIRSIRLHGRFRPCGIAVNSELDIIEKFLLDSSEILKTDGILAVITFHSLKTE
jgi:16S rRNA (cytosine1402-N4)-methyltransferase